MKAAEPETPRRAVLHGHYEQAFAAFQPPEPAVIRQRGCQVPLLPQETEGWWRAALIVMMQKGPVVVAALADGLIAAPPYVALLEVDGQQTTLRGYFMRELYLDSGDPKVYAVQVDAQQAKTLCEILLGQIVAQIRASLETASGSITGSSSAEGE